jgi:hypothetical protein
VGTPQAANYTFNLVPGVLTITSGGPTPDVSLMATPDTQSVITQPGKSSLGLLESNRRSNLCYNWVAELPRQFRFFAFRLRDSVWSKFTVHNPRKLVISNGRNGTGERMEVEVDQYFKDLW